MAERMALYDLLLAQTYRQEVMGIVMYLGNEPMRMSSTYSFFKFHYECEMIDARQLDPELFLQSDDAGEIIFAVLLVAAAPNKRWILSVEFLINCKCFLETTNLHC